MTWSTIARPQMRCSGFGRAERMRVPSPAARMIAETLTAVTAGVRGTGGSSDAVSSLRGEESNPYSLNQNQVSYRLNDPGNGGLGCDAT